MSRERHYMRKANLPGMGECFVGRDRLPCKLIAEEVFVNETYTLDEVAIEEGDTVFDAGGNIGLFSCYAAERCGPNGKVFTFEPVPQTFSILKKNIAVKNLEGVVHIHNFGLSDKVEERDLNYYRNMSAFSNDCRELQETQRQASTSYDDAMVYLEVAFPMLHKLLRAFPSLFHVVVPRMYSFYEKSDRVRCKFNTLERVLESSGVERIDFLKMDIEGAEREVLASLPTSVWSKIRKIALEWHFPDRQLIVDLLEDKGFVVKPAADAGPAIMVHAHRPEMAA
ncbi:MAG: FkbM family methyltransferase [Myxococcota bacterium]